MAIKKLLFPVIQLQYGSLGSSNYLNINLDYFLNLCKSNKVLIQEILNFRTTKGWLTNFTAILRFTVLLVLVVVIFILV